MLPFSEKPHSKEISSTCCSGQPTNMPNFLYPPNMSNFPYPPNMPNFGYPNMLPPNYNSSSTPMYNYGGKQIPMVMPVYNYPPHPGYQMVGNYSPMWEITQDYVKWNSAREDYGKPEQMSRSNESCGSSSPIGKKIAKVRKKGKNRKSKKGLYDDEIAKFILLQKKKLVVMKQIITAMKDEIAVLNADTSNFNEDAKKLHRIMTNTIREKYRMADTSNFSEEANRLHQILTNINREKYKM